MLIGNPMIFQYYPLEAAIAMTADAGYKRLEIWPGQLRECRTPQLRQQFAEYVAARGLEIVRYNAAAADYFGPLTDPSAGQAILEGLKQDIDITASYGAQELLTWEGRAPEGAHSEDIHGWILTTTVEVFQAAVEYAKARGVRLSIEPHPFTLGMDLGFLVKLCDRLDPGYFGITYDCCHFGVGLPDTYIDAIQRLGDRIQSIHFSDSDKRTPELHFPPGAGCLDLNGIVQAFRDIGFNGSFMLDLWGYPLPEHGTRIGRPCALEAMRRMGLLEGV